jgi:hypothetical protein
MQMTLDDNSDTLAKTRCGRAGIIQSSRMKLLLTVAIDT